MKARYVDDDRNVQWISVGCALAKIIDVELEAEYRFI